MATLAVTGTPPFSIFQSEFLTLSAALAAGQNWPAFLFIAGLVTIFAGFLVHMAKMNLGEPRRRQSAVAECPWKLGAMFLVAAVIIDVQRLAAGADLSARATNRSNSRRRDMNVAFSDHCNRFVRSRNQPARAFGDRSSKPCHRAAAERNLCPREMDLVAGFTAHLYQNLERAAREPVRRRRARRRTARFIFTTCSRSTRRTASSSCACRCRRTNRSSPRSRTPFPAVNWQEREVQDLFGLKLIGHPNPRRCALHDDWPEVHPLRKDFDLRTQLPPFQGERHKFRAVEGEGVFQVPVGPGARGHHRAGAFSVQRRGRAGAVSATAAVLHAQGHGETVREPAGAAWRPAGRKHFRRFEFRARHGVLPRHRTRRRAWKRRRAPARSARFASNWNGSTTTSATSARLHGRGVRHRQHARHAAQGARAARQRTAHRQPPPARHGLPGRRAL